MYIDGNVVVVVLYVFGYVMWLVVDDNIFVWCGDVFVEIDLCDYCV